MANKAQRELSLAISANAAKFNKVTEEVSAKTKKLSTTAKATSKGVNNSFGNMSKTAGGSLRSMTGGMGAFGSASSGAVGGIGVMAGAVRGLLVAMGPLALIVVAIGVAIKALSAYFKGTRDGAEDFAKIMGVLKGVMAFIQDAFISLGRTIVDAFKNPQEALDNFKEAFATATEGIVLRWEGLTMIIRGFIDNLVANLGLLKEKIRGIFGKEREDEIAKWEAKASQAQETILQGKYQLKNAAEDEEALADRLAEKEQRRADRQEKIQDILDKAKKQIQDSVAIEDKRQKLQDFRIKTIREESALQRSIDENRLKANDLELTADERHAAALQAEEDLNALYDIRLQKKDLEVQIAQDLFNLANSNKDDEEELARIEAERDELLAERAKKMKAIVLLKGKTLKASESITDEEKEQLRLVEEFRNQVRTAEADFGELYGTIKEATAEQLWNRVNDGIVQIGETLAFTEQGVKNLEGSFTPLGDAIYKAFQNAKGEIALTADQMEHIRQVTEEILGQDPFSKFATDANVAAEAMGYLATNMDFFKQSAIEGFEELSTSMVDIGGMLGGMLVNAVDGVTQAFSNLFSGQKKGWKDLGTQALKSIQQIINALLVQAIASMIAGESSKGLLGLALAAIGIAAIVGLWAGLPEFATGMGYVDKPTLAMVGEGPTGDYILTPKQLEDAAGGGRVEIVGQTRLEGQDLLIWYENAEKFKNTY